MVAQPSRHISKPLALSPAAVPGDRRNSTSVLAASASLLVARTAAENAVMLSGACTTDIKYAQLRGQPLAGEQVSGVSVRLHGLNVEQQLR